MLNLLTINFKFCVLGTKLLCVVKFICVSRSLCSQWLVSFSKKWWRTFYYMFSLESKLYLWWRAMKLAGPELGIVSPLDLYAVSFQS